MGKKLTIYLIDGNEYGPRTIEIGNWSGKAIYSPRSTLLKIINRPEFNNPGVYFLKSFPENDIYSERIYIGEAEKVGLRLKQHLNNPNKDFTEVIVFISKDELLTKSHIKYLESRIINLAQDSKAAEIDNENVPSLPLLHEADISDMEYFLNQIKMILPVMNFIFLVPIVTNDIKNQGNTKKQKIAKVYHIDSTKIKAEMYESDKGFIVRTGSQCSKKTSKSISSSWIKLRNKFLGSGILIEKDNYLEFTNDAIFTSLSAASSIVLGRQSAGPIKWIDAKGSTYKNNQDKYLADN